MTSYIALNRNDLELLNMRTVHIKLCAARQFNSLCRLVCRDISCRIRRAAPYSAACHTCPCTEFCHCPSTQQKTQNARFSTESAASSLPFSIVTRMDASLDISFRRNLVAFCPHFYFTPFLSPSLIFLPFPFFLFSSQTFC